MRPKIAPYLMGAHLLLLTLLKLSDNSAHALNTAEATANPTCSLKDNCNLNDNFLTATGETSDKAASKLENKIASIFEDKVNYSIKLFGDEDVIEYSALESNLSRMAAASAANLTLRQFQDAADVEEDERGESIDVLNFFNHDYCLRRPIVKFSSNFFHKTF